MPELPEVETVKNVLLLWAKAKKINKFHIYYPSILENSNEEQLNECLKDQEIINISRRGKFLIFEFENYVLLSHLRMEGKWHYGYFKGSKVLDGIEFDVSKRNEDKNFKHVHFVMEFNDGQILMYHDVRKFGRIGLYQKDNYESESSLKKLGKEPFDESLNANELYVILQKANISLKQMLLSQEFIAGVGNIYADEIAFKLNLLPTTLVKTLTLDQVENLIKVTKEVLNKAIKLGGSTIKSYHAANGVDGKFQNELLVYGRSGQTCPNCGYIITKTFLKGRGTSYCPACQKSNIKNRLIGITGAIGSGKSKVSSLFKERGYHLLDADKIVKEGQEKDNVLYKKMLIIFKNYNILNEDKSLNREKIREIILNDFELKKKLEDITHPYVKEVIYNEIFNNPHQKFVLDIPLLFEASLDKICDIIIFVDIDKNIQIDRLISRNTMSLNDAKGFEKSILDNEDKKSGANIIINNNGTIKELENQVDNIIKELE